MSPPLTFLMEAAAVPIYQRIVANLRDALVEAGHRVLLVVPERFPNYDAFLAEAGRQEADYYLVTNPVAAIAQYVEQSEAYGFELIDLPLLFIHHDNCFAHIHHPDRVARLIHAYLATGARSHHFFLERENLADLQSLGLPRAQPILHASEFAPCEPRPLEPGVLFVGHVLPELAPELDSLPWSGRLREDLNRRLAAFDHPIAPSAAQFAAAHDLPEPVDIHRAAVKNVYLALMHIHSHHFRGEVIRRVQAPVRIVGGDPVYMHTDRIPAQTFGQPNIRQFPPTKDYGSARALYASAGINLNITSLQFDHAVINRVIDAAAAGGFILTDWRPDLPMLTSVAGEIAYRTMDQLNEKIAYYSDPAHASRRREIARTLQEELGRRCTYPAVVESVVSALRS